MPELILILVLALLLFGPKKLPEIGKQIGRGLGEFRKASNDLKRTLEEEVEKATRVEETVPRPHESTKAAEPAGATEPAGAIGAAAEPKSAAPGANHPA